MEITLYLKNFASTLVDTKKYSIGPEEYYLGLLHSRQILYCLSHQGNPGVSLLGGENSTIEPPMLYKHIESSKNGATSHLSIEGCVFIFLKLKMYFLLNESYCMTIR